MNEGAQLEGWAVPLSQMTRLRSFREVDEVFRSKDFEQAGGGHGHAAPIYGQTLLSLSGADHFERRRLEARLFRKEEVHRIEIELLEHALAGAFAGRVTDARSSRVDLLFLLRSAFLRVAAAIVGIDGLDDAHALVRLERLLPPLIAGANVQFSLRDHEEVLREAKAARETYAADFVLPALRRRRDLVEAAGANGRDLPNDLLTVMVTNADHFARWGDDVLVNEATLFVVAGTGSPTTQTAHAVLELFRWFDMHPEDRDRVTDLEFLHAAAEESLRLHSGVPIKVRRAIRDAVLSSGRRVAAGEFVILEHGNASREASAYGADGDRFNLHRTLDPAVTPHGFAFGGGPHTCIGRGLTVGDPGTRGEHVGTLARTLARLFAWGIEADPDQSPRRNPETARDEYASVPVRFRSRPMR